VKKKMFEELLGSVREGGAILRGRHKPSRRIVIHASGVRTIRERTSLSQVEFAQLIGVSEDTSELGAGPATPNWAGSRASEHH
jgi:putative transcriptional regulator